MSIEQHREQFITSLAEAIDLFNSAPAQEERPFEEKYKSREILQQLLKGPELASMEKEAAGRLAKMVVDMLLGENLMETEEITPGCDKYKEVYQQYENGAFSDSCDGKLADMFRMKVLNSVGYSYVNADQTAEGLELFLKALDVYEKAKDKPEEGVPPPQTEEQRFVAELLRTVLKAESLQKLSTMTYFFMAQTYAKLGDKHKAARYCGLTLERQLIELERGNATDWNEREFVNNSIGLAQYYTENAYFRQAKIILVEALRLIGNENNADVGSLKFMLGNLYKALFRFNSELVIGKEPAETYSKAQETINEAFLNINMNDIKPIEDLVEGVTADKTKAKQLDETSEPVELYHDYEGLKTFFRKALGFYKDAMALLPLDGYVTDYCESLKEVSGLYKLAVPLETDQDRVLAIEKRREQMAAEVLEGLNPSIYKNLYIELTAELADAKTHIFEVYQQDFVKTGKGAKKLNRVGKEAIKAWNTVSEYMESNEQTLQQNYINCLYNKARIYTKMQETDKAALRQNLITALSIYQKVKKTILDMKATMKVADGSLEEQLKATEEFCDLLPIRIGKL